MWSKVSGTTSLAGFRQAPLRRVAMAACLMLSVTAVAPLAAQVPVVEAGSDEQGETDRSTSRSAGGGNELLLDLYMQMEALQQEVQTLRGIVEEQSYQIRRMQQQQQDRYLDLDRRISNLTTGGNAQTSTDIGAGAAPVPLNVPGNGTAAGPGPASGTATPAQESATPANDQDLYRSALSLLLEDADYQRSIQRFRQYIERFPNGRFIANAWYWLGEALILVENYAEARDAFQTVLNEYPEDPKAAGAMLKLGVVQSRMGNNQQARQTWQRLIETYPDSATEVRTARDYLNRLGAQ